MSTPQNGHFISIIADLSYVPRWGDYGKKFSDCTASHSFRVAAYALIAALVEKERFGSDIDIGKVVCRAIFHDMNEKKTGSIKHRTKKHPFVVDAIANAEKRKSEEYVSFLSKGLQPIFKDFLVDAEDDSFEGQLVRDIDTFDAVMFCQRELLWGTTFYFKEAFEENAKKIKNSTLKSVQWLMNEVENKTPFYDFLMDIMSLDTVERWTGRFNTVPDNDAIHEFRATALAIFFAYYEKVEFGTKIDIQKLVAKTIGHDLVEAITGDVNGPLKHETPDSKESWKKFEQEVSIQMIEQKIPDFLKPYFYDYMVNAKDDSYEGKIVEIVDKIDALIKTAKEISFRNREYETDFDEQVELIQERYWKHHEFVKFFLGCILHDLMSNKYNKKK